MFKTINGGKLPTRASRYSAGVDVYANEDVILNAGDTAIVPLGIKIDENYIKEMFIYDSWEDLEGLKLAKKIYKEDLEEWIRQLSGKSIDNSFEFESYKCKRLDDDIFEEMDKNGDIADYCKIVFKKFDYIKFMETHYIALKPRSSLRAKGLISHTGVIDLDYPDEIKIIIQNPLLNTDSITTDDFNVSYEIKKGDKIGQLLLMEHKGLLFNIETDEDRIGGFGSTGR